MKSQYPILEGFINYPQSFKVKNALDIGKEQVN